MDGSHVALVSLNLSMEGFETYRADTSMVLGINVALLAKVMKLADPTDSITLSAEDNPNPRANQKGSAEEAAGPRDRVGGGNHVTGQTARARPLAR